MKKWMKWLLAIVIILAIAAAALFWYFTKAYDNTAYLPAKYTTTANAILNEVEKSDTAANTKYKDGIIEIYGVVKEISFSDTTAALILIDSTGKSQILCSFQPQSVAAVKLLKEGSAVTVKGVFTNATSFKKEVVVASSKIDTVLTNDDDFGMLDGDAPVLEVAKPAAVYETIKKVTLIRCALIVKN